MPFSNEINASGAMQLRPALQATVLAAAGGRLKRVARGWCGAGYPQPIRASLVESLCRTGLMLIGADKRTARLTETGKWYARTLARLAAAIPQPNDEALQ